MRRVIVLLSIWALAVATAIPVGAADGEPPGDFLDVSGHTFEAAIDWLATNGITQGCNPPDNTLFCPDDLVTRGQMAVFLVRAFGYTDDGGGDLFSDDDGQFFERSADRLKTAGVTEGCNPPANSRYCGDQSVTRGQMAAFLVRALDLPAYSGSDRFIDDDGVFEGAIERLAQAEVTLGCNPPANDEFCPNDFVTRGQMAAFLRRGLSSSGTTDGAPSGSIDSTVESDVESGTPTDSDPAGSEPGEVDTPVGSGTNPLNPGISGGDLEQAPPPWELMSQLAMGELEVDYLTPTVSPPEGEYAGVFGDQTDSLSTTGAGPLGPILPWNSQGYLSQSQVPNPVGWIVMQQANGELGYCSGTLVSRNVVLTAAHCLGAPNYWFLPRQYGVLSGHPYFTASQQYFPTIYPQLAGTIQQNAFDYGVLILRPNAQGQHAGDIYGWFPIWMYPPTSTAFAANQLLDHDFRRVSIGYPIEGWFQRHCRSGGCYPWKVDATQGEAWTLGYGLYMMGWGGQTSGGNSGGGVFQQIQGNWYLVTMFTASSNDTSCGAAGFTSWAACGSTPAKDRYYGNKMWGPPLLNTAGDFGFDDFWRGLFG